jgi:hypothetical protein
VDENRCRQGGLVRASDRFLDIARGELVEPRAHRSSFDGAQDERVQALL